MDSWLSHTAKPFRRPVGFHHISGLSLRETYLTVSRLEMICPPLQQLLGRRTRRKAQSHFPSKSSMQRMKWQGLSAGSFNPTYWQQNTLNWLPDVRQPIFAAQTTGTYQNIY